MYSAILVGKNEEKNDCVPKLYFVILIVSGKCRFDLITGPEETEGGNCPPIHFD